MALCEFIDRLKSFYDKRMIPDFFGPDRFIQDISEGVFSQHADNDWRMFIFKSGIRPFRETVRY